MLQILETSTEAQRDQGLRQLTLTSGSADAETLLCLSVAYRDNVALDGEAPRFEPTGNIASNIAIAAQLTALTATLLQHPSLDQLPQ